MNRFLRYAALCAAAAYVALYLGIAVYRMGYPFELEWLEGGGLEHVQRILAGRPLYGEPALDFIAFPYTPLYYYASALGALILRQDTFVPMRLVSFLASLAFLAAIAAIVQRGTRQWESAWLATGMMAGTYGLINGWFDIARVDSLFLALLLWAVYGLHVGTPAGLVLGGLGLALAFLAKQTALMVALPLLLWSVFADRRRALFALTPFVLVLGLSTLYLQFTSDGWYWYYVVDLQRRVGFILPGEIPRFWTRDLLPLGIAGAFALLYIVTPGRLSRERQCLSVAILSMIVASWLSRVRSGNWINVVMPAYAALAIGFGLGRHEIQRLYHDLEQAPRRQLECLLFTLCLIQLTLPYNPFGLVPTTKDEQAGRDVVARIKATPGEVFVPCGGYLATMAGKTSYAHQMALFDVRGSADPRVAARLDTELAGAFREWRFAAVFACIAFEDYLRDAGLTPAYIKRELIFAPYDRTFLTVAGMPSRPQSIYVPPSERPAAAR